VYRRTAGRDSMLPERSLSDQIVLEEDIVSCIVSNRRKIHAYDPSRRILVEVSMTAPEFLVHR
jgi:hypothetical protein